MALALTLALSGDAVAEAPPPSEAPASSADPGPAAEVVPPRLLEAAEATFPEAFAATGVEAEVELLVTIGADGRVLSVDVPTPIGQGLDEAAADAVRRSRFEPARRGGVAVAARIRYRHRFHARAPEVQAADEPSPPRGAIVGRVLGPDERPLVDALVIVTAPDGAEQTLHTDADGGFSLEALAPGQYTIEVVGPDGSAQRTEEYVEPDVELALVLRPRADDATDEDAGFGARAVVDPPPREVTRRTIPRDVMARIPGTRGDALRSIELLPGVGRPPFTAGVLLVRGASPADSEVMLDGVPVPLLYHFGGLTSFLPSRFLERIDFQPGNFSSRYGRRTGGIVDVTTRDPATDRTHAVLEVSAIDASVFVEGPIGRRTSYAIGVRRSLIDLLFASMFPDDGAVRFSSAPVYHDHQVFVTHRPTARDRLRFAFYGASDGLRLFFDDEGSDAPDLSGKARMALRFHFLQASWDRRVGERTEQRITVQTGPHRVLTRFGSEYELDARILQTSGRAEWTTPIGERVRLVTGLDLLVLPYDFVYRGGTPIASEGQTGEGSMGALLDTRGTATFARTGAYVDLGVALGDLYLNLGQRVDHFGELGRFTYDPRLSARYTMNERVRWKAGIGLHSQAPEYAESLPGLGNPDLRPIRSMHAGAGVDVTPMPGVSLSIEGFAKYLWDRVVPTEDLAPPRFRSGGTGRIYGAELALVARPEDAPWFGYLSYTVMRSERRDPGQSAFRLFDFDQTHLLTASFTARLPRRWEVGGTFRLASGNPYTEIVGSIHDLSRPGYVPVHAQVNGARSPLFLRLDLRVEKQWVFDRMRLAVFLDVQNATNRRNQEGLSYSYDYRSRTALSGLPIVPSIGVRGEL